MANPPFSVYSNTQWTPLETIHESEAEFVILLFKMYSSFLFSMRTEMRNCTNIPED